MHLMVLTGHAGMQGAGGGGPVEADGFPPVPVADSRTAVTEIPLVVNVLANDVHPRGDVLTLVSATTNPVLGTVVVNPDNTLTFTSAAGYVGVAVVTYVVVDEDGETANGTLTLNVVAEAGPEITPANRTMIEDTVLTHNLFSHVTHPAGQDLTVTAVSVSSGSGSVVNNNDGTFTFTPALNWFGNAVISFTVEDESANTASGTVPVLVYAAGDLPILVPDTATADSGMATFITVLANDSHPDGTAMVVSAVSVVGGSAVGVASITADNRIRFVSAPAFSGTATINYTVTDAVDVSVSSTVTVTVVSNPDIDADVFHDPVSPYYSRQINGSSSGITATNSAHWSQKEGLGGPGTITGTEWRMTTGARAVVSLTASSITMPNGKTRVRWRVKPVDEPTARIYMRFELAGMTPSIGVNFDVTDDATLNADRITGASGIISNAAIAREAEFGWFYLRFDIDMTGQADRVGQLVIKMLDQPGTDLLMDRSTFFVTRCEALTLEAV